MEGDFMDKKAQRRINKNNRLRGSKFEKTVADFLGMEVVAYSGSNARFGYGDVRNDKWLIECKNITPTDNKITIKMLWIEKNRQRADDVNKNSAIAFMPSGKSDKFILLEPQDFEQFDISADKTLILIPKVHNTKNLIIDLMDNDIKGIKNGSIIKLTLHDKSYFILSLAKFKSLI